MRKSDYSTNSILKTVTTIKNIIETHPFDNKMIKDIIKKGGSYNRKLIQKAFKKLHGIGIQEFQMKKRMGIAANLLDEGILTRNEIAKRCGYNKANNFSAAFKRNYKMTPSAWVKSKLNRIGSKKTIDESMWYSSSTYINKLYYLTSFSHLEK